MRCARISPNAVSRRFQCKNTTLTGRSMATSGKVREINNEIIHRYFHGLPTREMTEADGAAIKIPRSIRIVDTSRLLKSDGNSSPEVKTLCQCSRVIPAGPQNKSLWGFMISAGWLAEILTIKNIGYRMMRLTTARYR